jgi:hypothetical protein
MDLKACLVGVQMLILHPNIGKAYFLNQIKLFFLEDFQDSIVAHEIRNKREAFLAKA